MNPEITMAEDQKKAWFSTRTGAVVGKSLADKYHWKVGSKIPILTPIWSKQDGNHTWEFDLVGIYESSLKGADQALLFNYDYFEEARERGKGKVGWYTIRVQDAQRAAEIAKQIDREFENSSSETKTEPEGAFAQAWASQVGILRSSPPLSWVRCSSPSCL